jgi:hypothetical protein
MAMVTGIWLPLHLCSHEHQQKHDFDNCPICMQLLVASKKFAVETNIVLPDEELLKEDFEFAPRFYLITFHCKPFDIRPPPSCL